MCVYGLYNSLDFVIVTRDSVFPLTYTRKNRKNSQKPNKLAKTRLNNIFALVARTPINRNCFKTQILIKHCSEEFVFITLVINYVSLQP